MPTTAFVSLSVPTWGRASQRISSGAPAATSALEHGAAAGILDAAVEFAVGEHARAALAELHVALLVERAARAEGRDVALARAGLSAALEEDWTKPGARKP